MADIHDMIAELRRCEAAVRPGMWSLYEGCARGTRVIRKPHEVVTVCVHMAPRNGSREDAKLIVAMRNALPALLDHIEGCEKSYDYAAKAWAEERARLNERIARLEEKAT